MFKMDHVSTIGFIIHVLLYFSNLCWADVCYLDSECPSDYHCCIGTEWCCKTGYMCTGTSTCKLITYDDKTIIVPVGVIVGIVMLLVAAAVIGTILLLLYRKRRKNTTGGTLNYDMNRQN